MRTVHFNRRALGIIVLIGTGVILLTISHISASLSQSYTESVPVARDALARRKIEKGRGKIEEDRVEENQEKIKDQPNEQKQKLADSEANVDHQDADVAAEKHEDFIDEPRKPPEEDQLKSGRL